MRDVPSAPIVPKGEQMARLAKKTVSVLERSNPMTNLIVRLWEEEEGQDLTEYGLLLACTALAAIASMNSFGSVISGMFRNASISLS